MFYKQNTTIAAPPTYVTQNNTYVPQEKLRTAPPLTINNNQPQIQPVYYRPPEFYRPVEQPANTQTSNPFTVTFNTAQTFQAPTYLTPIQQNAPVFSDKLVPNNNISGTFSKDAWSSVPFVSDKQSISSNITSAL